MADAGAVSVDMKPILIANALLAPKILSAVYALFQFESRDLESYMRQNAPWKDQTGNARNGLSARPFQEGTNVGIDLFHTVPYGIWLETRFSGAYAIIVPTINDKSAEVLASVRGLLGRM